MNGGVTVNINKLIKKIIVCITITGIISSSALTYARVITAEESAELYEYYKKSENYKSTIVKAKNIVKGQDDIITFQVEMNKDGSEPDNKQLICVIDEKTVIPDKRNYGFIVDMDKFVSGELPWIDFYFLVNDYEKAMTGKSEILHIEYVWHTAGAIYTYPNAEEKAMQKRLEERQIMIGTENGFEPLKLLTRAEFCKIAVMISNPNYVENSICDEIFYDVSAEHWAYPYICYAKQANIIDGYPNGEFMPENAVISGEVVKILLNILGFGERADQLGDYPQAYMKCAEEIGLLKGITIGYDHVVLRKEAMHLICNALDIYDELY